MTKYLLPILLLSSLHADPVLEEIEAAKKAYASGEFTEAHAALQQAAALVAEKKGLDLKKAFPEQLAGWVGKEIENESAGLAAFGGGGLIMRRKYVKEKQSASLQIAVDSPLMAQMAALMNNPAMASQMGHKVRRVKGQKVMIDESAGSISLLLHNRFHIQIEGRELKEEELTKMLQSVDFDVLTKLK